MSKTILIIEDDIFLQGLEATKLKKEGYNILSASSGKEAYIIFDSKTKIDILLLDLMLPEIDGFEILEKIKKERIMPGMPVIVFSNLSEEQDMKRAQTYGVKEFMVKSNFNLDELAKKIKEIVGE